MLRPRTFLLAAPALLIAVILGTYLVSLPRAMQHVHRTPCRLLGLDHPKLDRQPGSLVFTDLDGKPYPISRLRGRLVLLNFWLTTCKPCLDELPSLLELARRYGNKGMMLVMVSTDKNLKAIRAFLEKVPRLKSLPPAAVILRDPRGKIAKQLGTTKYPETYLVQPDGTWGGRVVGGRNWTGRGIIACLTSRLP
jgi:cytochrome c biogenesis protein CcmG, thiol:disulfide interchange protein DsbE